MRAPDWHAAELPSTIERFSNGLTVVVHVEGKSPVVAVYLGYSAGSRDEPASKAGLAHLSEHLMFTGTKRNPGSYFASFEQRGAAWMNAFVREDFSAYFATVPAAELDFALSMESDRMVNLADAIDDERVDRQRKVVINELRQREGQPYGCVPRILAALVHPPGHPYAHPPDGLESELNSITTDDVRGWIESRHLPHNAILIVVGDVEPLYVLERADHYFGQLPTSGISGRSGFSIAHPTRIRRQIQLPVNQARLYIAWNGPPLGSADFPALELACEILAGGKSSRLLRRATQSERVATAAALDLRPRQLTSLIVLTVAVRPEIPLSGVEALVREEIEQLARVLDPADLDIARLRIFSRMVRGYERVGGPESRSDALGQAAMLAGSPASHTERLRLLASAPTSAVAGALAYLADHGVVLEIHPAGRRSDT